MAKKKITSRTTRVTSPRKATKVKSSKSAVAKKKTLAKSKQSRSSSTGRARKVADKPARRSAGKSAGASVVDVLARAEANIGTAVETLNNQMNVALVALTELAIAQGPRGKAVVRTAPLDRATSMFQRLVAEVLDEQLTEMLPPLITLRNEIAQEGSESNSNGLPNEFSQRAQETLDHVLAVAGVQIYEVRPGDIFDPLIHLAVGETHHQDLADGTVVKQLQPGFRSARGKVLAAAKVRINRR